MLVVGDFNIDTSSPSCDALNLVSTLSSFGPCHLPTDHTLITSSTASTIDLLFTNDPALIDQLRVVPGLGTSDHCSLFCSLVIKKSRTQSIKRKIWLYKEANFSDLNIALENSLPPEVVLTGGDVNSTWPLFETAFWDSVRKFIPSKIVRLKDSNPPWYTGEVWLALRKRDRARRTAMRLQSSQVWRKFRALRNRAVSTIRLAKRSYFTSLCFPSANSKDDLWKAYHKLSNNSTRVPTTLVCGSESASSASFKARMLNDYFVSCFSQETDRLSPDHKVTVPSSAECCQLLSAAPLMSCQ